MRLKCVNPFTGKVIREYNEPADIQAGKIPEKSGNAYVTEKRALVAELACCAGFLM